MNSTKPYLTYGALILAVLFWGFSFVATKIALQSFSPFCLIFCRFAAASLFFVLLLFHRGAPPIRRDSFKKLFLLALFQPGLYFFFETYGLQYTSATKTSLIIATTPIIVLLLSIIFLKERLRPLNTLGIAISLAGVSLLIFGSPASGLAGALLGDTLVFGAVLSAAIYMVFTRYLGQSISPVQITGLQVIFGTVLFLPFFLWDMGATAWGEIPAQALLALAWLTIFATIGAFLCYNFALSRIPAARASVFINAIPLVTACGAWLLLGESLTIIQIFGGAVVIGAVYLANWQPRQALYQVPADQNSGL